MAKTTTPCPGLLARSAAAEEGRVLAAVQRSHTTLAPIGSLPKRILSLSGGDKVVDGVLVEQGTEGGPFGDHCTVHTHARSVPREHGHGGRLPPTLNRFPVCRLG